jgi:signal transduction histidine kinase
MRRAKDRSAAFFIQYYVLLLLGLLWLQVGHVRAHTGENLRLVYALLGAAACYVAVRAYLVLGRGLSGHWTYLWLSIDLMLITGVVRLTGGMNSEAALVYVWPLASSAIQRLPYRTLAAGAAIAVLYTAATWPDALTHDHLAALGTRLLVVLLATSQGIVYSLAEASRVEENAKLREKVALADYRERLAQEMHDGIQHYLVDIGVRLELARRQIADDPAQAANLAVDQRFAVRQAADELRYLVRLLRSPAVDREGFLNALRNHLATFGERASVSTPLRVEGAVVPVPPPVAHAAFRIIQEALTNIERHAQARQVQLTLSFAADVLECLIADDGIGFVPPADGTPGVDTGFGLSSMRQRAAAVGGSLQIDSAPGQGTKVMVVIPLTPDRTRAAKGNAHGEDQAAHRGR